MSAGHVPDITANESGWAARCSCSMWQASGLNTEKGARAEHDLHRMNAPHNEEGPTPMDPDELTLQSERLPGTDYTHVTLSKQNGDWLDETPAIGDELILRMRVRTVEKGKRLTDDGLQNTVKLEVVGSPRALTDEEGES